MNSQFDETTELEGEEAAKQYARELGGWPSGLTMAHVNGHTRGWDQGRNSAKESLEILARAANDVSTNFDCDEDAHRYKTHCRACICADAIAAVKARGDWPLPEGREHPSGGGE